MNYKLVKTDSFQRDLDAAIGYIALSLANKMAAAALLNAIQKSYQMRRKTPCFSYGDINRTDSAYNKASTENKVIPMSDVPKTKGIKRQDNPFALLTTRYGGTRRNQYAQGDCIDFTKW